MVVGVNTRRTNQADLAWIDDDQSGAFSQSTLHLRREYRVRSRRVGADDHDDVSVHDAVERLRAGGRAECRFQAVTRRRVADARAGINVVVEERCADHLLHDVNFFVGAARRGDATDGLAAVFLPGSP